MVGLDEKSWRDRWHWRYDGLVNITVEWELEAVRAVRRERLAAENGKN